MSINLNTGEVRGWTLEAWHAAFGAVPSVNLAGFVWDRLGNLTLIGPRRMEGSVDGAILPAPRLAWAAAFWTGRAKNGTTLLGWKLDVAGVPRTVIIGISEPQRKDGIRRVSVRSPVEIVAELAASLLTPNHVKSTL